MSLQVSRSKGGYRISAEKLPIKLQIAVAQKPEVV